MLLLTKEPERESKYTMTSSVFIFVIFYESSKKL
jgi:hypothetical protein